MKTKKITIVLITLLSLLFLGCKQPAAPNTKDTTLRMAAKVYLGIPINRMFTEKTLTVTIGKNIALPLSIEIDNDEIISATIDGTQLTFTSKKEGSTNVTLVDKLGVESKPTNVVVTSKDLDLQVVGSYKTALSLQSALVFSRFIQYGNDTLEPLTIRFDDPSIARATPAPNGRGGGHIAFKPLKNGSTLYVLVDANGVESDEKLLQVGGPYDFDQPKELTLTVGETKTFTITWPGINTLGLLVLSSPKATAHVVAVTGQNDHNKPNSDTVEATVTGISVGESKLEWLIFGEKLINGSPLTAFEGAPSIKVTVIEKPTVTD